MARRPESRSKTLSGFHIDAMYEPASDVGGDFYVAAARGIGKLRVVIGDACGKGVIASRLVARIERQVRALCHSDEEPAECLSRLNVATAGELASDVFVTAICLEMDAGRRTLRFANAGHVPLLVRKRDGSTHLIGGASGPPLGVLESTCYVSETAAFDPGDVVLLMTDGVVEAFGQDVGEMRALRLMVAGACHPAPETLIRLVSERVRAGRKTAPDDATLIAITTPS